MALKKITKITNKQIAEKGVQALADRPNLMAQYGTSGLSATQLKLWFDKLAMFLAERINEISDAISGDEATNYIRVCLDTHGVNNLGALITAFTDGNFAAKILQLFPSAGSNQKQALQAVVNNVAKQLADLEEKKLAKVTKTSTYKRAYIIMPDGTQATVLISETALGGAIPIYSENGILTSKTLPDNSELSSGDDVLNRDYFKENISPVKESISLLNTQLQKIILYSEEFESLCITPVTTLYDNTTESMVMLCNIEHKATSESLKI